MKKKYSLGQNLNGLHIFTLSLQNTNKLYLVRLRLIISFSEGNEK